ncbi:chlorophyllase-1 [Biomphalaria glabrata]|nr:chlorophyllase-1-like [Biomphalaria glabrata]
MYRKMTTFQFRITGLILALVNSGVLSFKQRQLAVSPFTPGQFPINSIVVDPKDDKSPLHSTVFYPEVVGTFIPIYFIGGLYGHVLSEDYSDFLTEVASHGFIVIGMDPNSPLLDRYQMQESREKKLDLYLQQMKWLAEHMGNKTTPVADWNRPVLMCQSAGCDDTLEMIHQNRSIAKASVFIDPVSVHSLDMKIIPSKIAVLTYMAELSEAFPYCCIAGMGWNKIYELMTCVKVRMEVKKFGHCDLLDHAAWALCHDTKICRTTDDSRLQEYRSFTTGIVVAFLQWTVFGLSDMAKYVTQPALMPLTLKDFAFNVTCST